MTSRDLELAADVSGVLGGVADVVVDGPEWSVDPHHSAFHELQAAAVHEARARAQRYAAALGGTLGRLVELSDIGHGGVFQSRASKRAASPAMSVIEPPGLESLDLSPRPVELSASVNARWYLVLPE